MDVPARADHARLPARCAERGDRAAMITDSLAAEERGLAGIAYVDARGIKEGAISDGDNWLYAPRQLGAPPRHARGARQRLPGSFPRVIR